MTDQRRRMEKALRGCAEAGVPDTVDLWPGIRDRMAGELTGATATGEARPSTASPRRSSFPRLVPDTALGRILAVVSVLLLGFGIYTAYGPVQELFRFGLSDAGGPSVEESTELEKNDDESRVTHQLFRGALPGGEGEKIGLTKTSDEATVTLEWAYADARTVVVGIEARDLNGVQKINGYPSVLQPVLLGEENENEAGLPPRVDVTDASGEDFTNVDGMTQYPGAVAVFETPENFEHGREHRFRLEVPLDEAGMPRMPGDKPKSGPFVFNFKVPMQPVPEIEVNQTIEAQGITLTLDRVVNSAGRPQAIVCVESYDDKYTLTPWLEREGMPVDAATAPRRLKDGCWSLTMGDPIEGRSSVTVAYVHAFPRSASNPNEDGKKIRGPWTFEFRAPEP